MDTTTDQLLRHADFVRRLCRGLLSDADAADDVAQDTLVAALGRPGIRAPRAWLAAVARRLAARHLRGEARRARRETAAARRDTAPSAHEIAAQADLQRRLAEEVRALDEPYRTVVILRYFHDLTPKEIARKLGAPYETVHSRLRRAHALLRARLDETHERRAWLPALAALAWPRRTGAAAVGAGVLAAAAALCVALFALGGADRGGAVPRSVPEGMANEAAAARDAEEAAAEPAVTTPAHELVRATGRVTTLWGSPVPGARVVVMPSAARPDYWDRYPMPPAPPAETVAAIDGSFALDAPVGRTGWVLLAHAPGMAWASRDLALDFRRQFLDLRLSPGEGIAGVVVDETGAPVADARVRAMTLRAEIPGAFVRTGPDGRFAFDAADRVHADHDELTLLESGWGCPRDRMRIVLAVAEALSGDVVTAEGTPAADVRVEVNGRSVTSDGTGRFLVDDLPIREGSLLEVSAGGERGMAQLSLRYSPGLHVSIRLPPTHRVRGRVVEMHKDQIVGPVPGLRLSCFTTFPWRPEAVTDEQGHFEMGGVLDGMDDRIGVADEGVLPGFFGDWRSKVPGLADGEVGIVVRRRGTAIGMVLDERGLPLPGACMGLGAANDRLWSSLEGENPYARVSDEHGMFRIPTGTGTSMRVWAAKDGFVPACSEPFLLEDGEEREGIVVKLGAGAALIGRATDPDGSAIPGTAVSAGLGVVYSDASGTFVLRGLPNGPVSVLAACPGYQWRSIDTAIPRDEPLTLVLERSLTFRGRLRTVGGEPLPFAQVGRLKPANEPGQGDGWSQSVDDGMFTFRELASGRFLLTLRSKEWELVEPKAVYHSATEGVVDVLVRRKAGTSIAGRVLREDGQPFPLDSTPQVVAMPEGSDDPGRWRSTECRPDGSFTLKNLDECEHVIVVTSCQAVFEEHRVAAGAKDVTIHPTRPRRIAGQVLDAAGQPVSGCEVRAVPPGKGPLQTRMPNSRREVRWPVYHEVCWTGPDGAFAFERLVGEQVAIWAFRNGHGLAVETVATDQDGVELRLPAGLTLAGVLLDAERRPLADHQVIVAGADRMVRQAKTDTNGAFELHGLPEGACEVSVMDKGGRLVLETTVPAATEGTELRLPAR